MTYKPFIVGFRKPSGKEYRITVMAESGTQAVRIVHNRLSDKLGAGEFYSIEEDKENDDSSTGKREDS